MIAGLKTYSTTKVPGVQWLGEGEVPAHWSVERLKCCMANIVEQTTLRSENELYVALEHVESWTGRLTEVYEGIEFDSQVKGFRAGDILFGKLRPYLAKVTRPTGNGVCVGEFLVLRPRDKRIVGSYMEHTLRSRPMIDAVHSSTFGAKMPRANWQFIGTMPIAVPPVTEQTAIARFLDHAGQHIQHYIDAKQRLIALLEEQKRAVVHEVVTGQVEVRTGRRYRAYKDSGADWLQEIPAHWEMRRSKRAFRPRTELAKPDDIQLSATQAYGVIAQEEFENRAGRKVVRISRHLEQRRHVEIDDFVISMRSFQGGLERAWVSGCIRSSYIVLRPITTLEVGYFGYLFKSVGYISALQATANFIRDGQDLNFDNFCRVDVPFPPIGEQERIVEALDDVTERIALAIDHARRQIKLLTEYCTALIADVVTGKVDVREATAKLPKSDVDDLNHNAGMDRDRTSVPDADKLKKEASP